MKYSNSNKPLVCMQTNSTCYKGTKTMKVLGVLFHSTGANNPNLKRYVQPTYGVSNYDKMISLLGKNTAKNDWNHISMQAGLNAWIGKLADGTVATVQTMPWNYRPWGCGYGSRGSCNDGWIQFEICEDGLNNKDYFNKVYNEAVELTAYLCKLYGLDPNGKVKLKGVSIPVLTCHADSYKLGFGSNHGDINHWFNKYGKSMKTVRADVAKLLAPKSSKGVSNKKKESNSSKSSPKSTSKDTNKVKYYVQVGEFKSKANADKRAKELVSKNFHVILKKSGNMYIVQCGVFSNKTNAQKLVNDIKSSGIDAYISTAEGDVVSTSTTSSSKSVEQLAKEVWQGKWGSGSGRRKKLTEAGYDYEAIQAMINKLYG